MVDEQRLRSTLGRPELAWLVDRIRQRISRGGDLLGKAVLHDPNAAQRSALDRLLGRPASTSRCLSIALPQLEDLLRRAGIADSLLEAVEQLSGPLTNLRQEKIDEELRWKQLFADAERRVADERLQRWLSDLRASGLLRRLSVRDVATGISLLDTTLRLIERLPAPDIPLPELAAAIAGNSHALDAGNPLSTLAIRALASLTETPFQDTPEARRDLWSAVGVICDELSAPLLVHNLLASPESLTGNALCLHASYGEPYRLTVRQLLRHPAQFSPTISGAAVYVCENPTVVAAAADRLGSVSKPLICVEGQPKSAARLLLDQLRAVGIELHYHGDFDWPGIRIANHIVERYGAKPWRMLAEDYLVAAAAGSQLKGEQVAASWDASLSEAMTSWGRAVHEEAVLESLLGDLGPDREQRA